MLKISSFLLLLAFTTPLSAQHRPHTSPFGREELPIDFDGRRQYTPDKDVITEIETVKGTPLFANLPFLRLRTGEEVVIAQAVHEAGKAQGTRRQIKFFLKRGGQYQEVRVDESRGLRFLMDWSDVGYFDWEPTRANADTLWEWSLRRDEKLTIENLRAVEAVLLPDFAEHLADDWQRFTDYDRWESGSSERGKTASVPQPGFVRVDGTNRQSLGPIYEFAGLSYNADSAKFSVFEMHISTAGIVRRAKAILSGPKPVNESNFRHYSGPNSGGNRVATGRTLLRLQAQKARHEKFRALVFKVLGPTMGMRFP